MLVERLKSKIAQAIVTDANLYYEGSITIARDLADAVDLFAGQKVQVLDINNGNRFETYVIFAPKGSGVICLNGPAARQGLIGDQLMILAYVSMEWEEAKKFEPKIIHLDHDNRIKNKS